MAYSLEHGYDETEYRIRLNLAKEEHYWKYGIWDDYFKDCIFAIKLFFCFLGGAVLILFGIAIWDILTRT